MENHIVHKRVQSYAYFFNQQIFPHFFCKIISFSLPPTAKASRKRHLICWKLVKTHIIYSIRPFGQKKFDPPVTRRIIRRHTPGRKVEHRLMPRFSLACGTINGAARLARNLPLIIIYFSLFSQVDDQEHLWQCRQLLQTSQPPSKRTLRPLVVSRAWLQPPYS